MSPTVDRSVTLLRAVGTVAGTAHTVVTSTCPLRAVTGTTILITMPTLPPGGSESDIGSSVAVAVPQRRHAVGGEKRARRAQGTRRLMSITSGNVPLIGHRVPVTHGGSRVDDRGTRGGDRHRDGVVHRHGGLVGGKSRGWNPRWGERGTRHSESASPEGRPARTTERGGRGSPRAVRGTTAGNPRPLFRRGHAMPDRPAFIPSPDHPPPFTG